MVLLAVVWGLEHFRLHIYAQPIELLPDHKALKPLMKRNRFKKQTAQDLRDGYINWHTLT